MKTKLTNRQKMALKEIFHYCLNRWITEKEVAFQNWFLTNKVINYGK